MRIEPYLDTELWILAANVGTPSVNDLATAHAKETSQNVFEKCWTGEGWAGVASAAQRFVTRQEAEEYLAANRQRMEQA
ncbi:MAG: hypothetical protein L0211_04205 [Planctomycetaceae bacterium]|nr:hypothetical protein [Planctomycetaceae bacterium]